MDPVIRGQSHSVSTLQSTRNEGQVGQLDGRKVEVGGSQGTQKASSPKFSGIRNPFKALAARISTARAERQLASNTKAASKAATNVLTALRQGIPDKKLTDKLTTLMTKSAKLDSGNPSGKATSLLLGLAAKLAPHQQLELHSVDLNALTRGVHADIDQRFDKLDALGKALSDSGMGGPAEDTSVARNQTKTKLESILMGMNRELHPTTAKELGSNLGSKHVSIKELSNGKIEVSLDKPKIEHLVLSGGGAKGAAYPGGIKALEDSGVLAGLKQLHGSSAGAITAAMLACGLDADTFNAISGSLDFMDAIENNDVGWLKSKLQDLGAKTGSNIISVLGRMGTSAMKLENIIRDNVRTALVDHLTHFDMKSLETSNPKLAGEMKAIQKKLTDGGSATFADLRTISQAIPAVKDLVITGTCMIEGRPQLAIFSYDSTPDMDVAIAAHMSGSFPKVFQGQQYTLPSGETHTFVDGGAMLNIPVPDMVNPNVDGGPFPNPNALIFGFEGDEMVSVFQDDKGAKGGVGSNIKDKIVGAKVSAAGEFQTNRLRNFRDQIVQVNMQTSEGDFGGMLSGTLNFAMPKSVQTELQANLEKNVNAHLAERSKGSVSAQFNSLDSALLALPEAQFHEVTSSPSMSSQQGVTALAQFRKDAMVALDTLNTEIAKSYAQTDSMALTPDVKTALAELDRLAGGNEDKLAFLGTQLNKSDNRNLQGLLNFGRYKTDGDSITLKAGLKEAETRDVKTASFNQIRDLIMPSRFRLAQTKANIRVLQETELRLDRAKTREDYNDALKYLADNYKSRNKASRSESETVTLAKSAMFKLQA